MKLLCLDLSIELQSQFLNHEILVFRSEPLTGDVTLASLLQSVQEKDVYIIKLEHRVRELVTGLDLSETRCQ